MSSGFSECDGLAPYPGTLRPVGKGFRASMTHRLGTDVTLALHPCRTCHGSCIQLALTIYLLDIYHCLLVGFGSFASTALCFLCFTHSHWQTWWADVLLLVTLSQRCPRDKVSSQKNGSLRFMAIFFLCQMN